MQTIRTMADELGVTCEIARAITYEPVKLASLWQIPVEWAYNFKSKAGTGSAKLIRLHPGLQIADKKDFIETFLHEVAHAMEGLIYGPRYGHTYNWFEQMIRLGQIPQRTHNIAACRSKATLAVDVEDL